MNPVTDFLTQYERDLMGTDAVGITTELQLAVAITYKAYQSRSFVPSTGASTSLYVNYAVTAIRSDIEARDVKAAQGLYMMGDVRLLVAKTTLPVSPGSDDRLIIGGTTYEPVAWNSDPADLFWRFVIRQLT